MKKLMRPIVTIGLGLVLALFSAALTYSSAPPAIEGTVSATAVFLQSTPTITPTPQDLSEIGSTDGIIVMGIIISLIIIIPILLRRKSWMETQ
jgi:FtsH-binding integral membrane protein